MKVLIFTTGMGHQSIAEAAKEAFDHAGWQTKIHFSKFSEINFSQTINFFSSSLQKQLIRLVQNKKLLPLVKKLRVVRKKREIERVIADFKPKIIVSTYFLYNGALEDLKEKYHFAFLNIVENPRIISPFEFSQKAEINFVYDQKTAKEAEEWGIGKKKLAPIGWLTRKRFYQSLKTKKQINREFLTILLCAGSWGSNNILKFLLKFLKLPTNVNLYLVAGKNKVLFKSFKLFENLVKSNIFRPKQKLNIRTFSFVKNLNELITQSDILCGKAGPNLIFDSVACGKPFVAITHYLGQEDGNLEIIREKNLGWVAETPKSFENLLLKIINNPKILLNCQKDILLERNKNLPAGKKLVKLAEKLTANTLATNDSYHTIIN